MDSLAVLRRKSLVVIFATAPTGLGHLRVTRALYHGLPKDVTPLMLGAQDKAIDSMYRFISIHPLTRMVMESLQKGALEDVFTSWYRLYLQSHTDLLYQQILTVLDERIDVPQTVLIVATHFGLAHQLSSIKEKLAKEREVKVFLVVQVTDDSPQHLWYIDGADMIFVPSERTKHALHSFGKNAHLPEVPFIVTSYPISPILAEPLSVHDRHGKLMQFDATNTSQIHISIPISGAAVGTLFYTKLIDQLHRLSNRFYFHVVAKHALYTRDFLDDMIQRMYVKVHTSAHDRGIVDLYEQVYLKETISLEITKPSEQSFKALYTPAQIGGSILLFAEPVGRQERDNLAFLKRHELIPTASEHDLLYHNVLKNEMLDEHEREKLLLKATAWRGLILPHDPINAASFIHWCLREGIFQAMMSHDTKQRTSTEHGHELSPGGVSQFWLNVAKLIASYT
jgi:hypothetical protein